MLQSLMTTSPATPRPGSPSWSFSAENYRQGGQERSRRHIEATLASRPQLAARLAAGGAGYLRDGFRLCDLRGLDEVWTVRARARRAVAFEQLCHADPGVQVMVQSRGVRAIRQGPPRRQRFTRYETWRLRPGGGKPLNDVRRWFRWQRPDRSCVGSSRAGRCWVLRRRAAFQPAPVRGPARFTTRTGMPAKGPRGTSTKRSTD